jgi:hypothetical protein
MTAEEVFSFAARSMQAKKAGYGAFEQEILWHED